MDAKLAGETISLISRAWSSRCTMTSQDSASPLGTVDAFCSTLGGCTRQDAPKLKGLAQKIFRRIPSWYRSSNGPDPSYASPPPFVQASVVPPGSGPAGARDTRGRQPIRFLHRGGFRRAPRCFGSGRGARAPVYDRRGEASAHLGPCRDAPAADARSGAAPLAVGWRPRLFAAIVGTWAWISIPSYVDAAGSSADVRFRRTLAEELAAFRDSSSAASMGQGMRWRPQRRMCFGAVGTQTGRTDLFQPAPTSHACGPPSVR